MKFRTYFFLIFLSILLISCGKNPDTNKNPLIDDKTSPISTSSGVYSSGSSQIIPVPPFDPNQERVTKVKQRAHTGVIILQRTNGPVGR